MKMFSRRGFLGRMVGVLGATAIPSVSEKVESKPKLEVEECPNCGAPMYTVRGFHCGTYKEGDWYLTRVACTCGNCNAYTIAGYAVIKNRNSKCRET